MPAATIGNGLVELGAIVKDERSAAEVFRWFAEKPVTSAFVIVLKEDGSAECSVCNGSEKLFAITADMLMQIVGGDAPSPSLNRSERRRRNSRP